MTERENSALVKIEPYLPFSESASGIRVAQYLLSGESYSAAQLPKHIDFGLYSSVIDGLYAEYRNVYRYDQSNRRTAFDILEATKRELPLLSILPKELIDEIDDEFFGMVNQKAAGERLAVVYQDPITKAAGVSTTTFGEYSSVSNQVVARLRADGKQPFLKLHTHPEDVLFSPYDYYQMITPSEEEKPLFKGQLVLCPTLQILALTTAQTPLMSPSKARDLVETWDRIVRGENEEGKLLIQAAADIENAYVEWHKKEARTLLQIQRIVDQGRISRRDRRSTTREVEKAQARKDSMDTKHEVALREAQSAIEKYSNGKLNEFARVINVVLFISTNARDFYRFTA